MGKSKYLDPKARERINEVLDLGGEMSLDEMVELVMPHMMFDIDSMKLQTTKTVCRNIAANRKDWRGTRTTFAVKEDKKSVYVDVDRCDDVNKVRRVEEDLREKEQGIARSRIKARNRRLVLEGQITMDEYMSYRTEVG